MIHKSSAFYNSYQKPLYHLSLRSWNNGQYLWSYLNRPNRHGKICWFLWSAVVSRHVYSEPQCYVAWRFHNYVSTAGVISWRISWHGGFLGERRRRNSHERAVFLPFSSQIRETREGVVMGILSKQIYDSCKHWSSLIKSRFFRPIRHTLPGGSWDDYNLHGGYLYMN